MPEPEHNPPKNWFGNVTVTDQAPQLSIEHRPVLTFNPGQTLVDASRTAGLVVVGSRGRGGFDGRVSVAAKKALRPLRRIQTAIAARAQPPTDSSA